MSRKQSQKGKADPALIEEIKDIKTLREIIEYGTKKGGDKRHYVFLNDKKQEEERSFNQTWDEIVALGTWYYMHGMDGQKKICIIAENSYEWIIAYYATLVGDNITVPMDIKLDDDDIVDQIVRCGCDGIVYTEKTSHFIDALKNNPENPVKEYFYIPDFPEYKKAGREAYKNGDTRFVDAVVKPDDLAAIVYTSGTTGKSKGVMLTQHNITSNIIASSCTNSGSHAMGFLPLNHTFCWVSALFVCYILSEWGYICDSIAPKSLANDMKKYHPQNFAAVPLVAESIYDQIWRTARKTGQEKKLKAGLRISKTLMKLGIDRRRKIFKTIIDNLGGELEFIFCGGAYIDSRYETGMYDFGIQLLSGYGLTECSPAVTCNSLFDFKLGSVGKPLPCNVIKIADPDEDGVGEIMVKGDNVMKGYFRDPEATAEVFDGEWFRTGDYGWIDEDGFLFFRGRKKNLIVLSNGKNISPEELEDKLRSIEFVSEVLVYQENDQITAEFFLNEDEYPDARDQLKARVNAVNETLPSFKRITRTKIRDTEFEKTTTLKIVRSNHL
ncbi:MAG: AMP-binding protein [Clostridia bacterium]|nr:AMP-binding protein [Clostridia bacterium]